MSWSWAFSLFSPTIIPLFLNALLAVGDVELVRLLTVLFDFYSYFLDSDPRTLPLLVSALSVAYILLRASFLSLYSWRKSRTTASYNVINADDDDDNTDEVETPASAPPTWTLDYRTSIHLTRLLASLALLGLGINALLANKGAGKWDDQGIIIDELFVVFYVRPLLHLHPHPQSNTYPQLYTSLLAFLTVFPFPSSKITTWRIPQRASYYLTALHLVAWGVYAWLDIVPLAIIQPEGEKELQAAFRDQFGRLHVREMNSSASANAGVDASGNLGWREITRLSLLSFTAIVVPLILPMQYVPVDPKVRLPPSLPPIPLALTHLSSFPRIPEPPTPLPSPNRLPTLLPNLLIPRFHHLPIP